jgi:hypothetical protein
MADIPQPVVRPEQGIADLIYASYEREAAKKPRWLGNLGPSGIADPCLRRVFYAWRGYLRGVAEGRIQRLFQTGHREEVRVVADLATRTGMQVWAVDPATGRQFKRVHKSGHYLVRPDGVIKGVLSAPKTPHLLEIKTHNDKSFKALLDHGMPASKPEHYIQCLEGMSAMKLTRYLYVGVNKNDERYYFERGRPNARATAWVADRLGSLLNSDLTPPPLSLTQDAYECTFCPYKGPCAGGPFDKNCRTCRHSTTGEEGTWVCDLLEKTLTQQEQQDTCGANYSPKG